MQKANDHLSRACTALLEYQADERYMWEDVQIWQAPVECFELAMRSSYKKLMEVLTTLGFTSINEVKTQVQERTTSKWVHHNLI